MRSSKLQSALKTVMLGLGLMLAGCATTQPGAEEDQYATHDPLIVLSGEEGYYHFVGLTIRAGAWHGVYSMTSGNVFEHCDVKFNGGQAASSATVSFFQVGAALLHR